MEEAEAELWEQLRSFEIDEGTVELSFRDRLARDNGWSHEFAGRVIDEYHRFLFLGQVAGHPITPSDEVDQAWHLHLTYTRSYWDKLCGEILGTPFHHGPTEGGEAEDTRFADQYEQTLASYRRWFGAEPPTDIWPPAKIRFGEAPYYVRVNTKRKWLVDRPGRNGVGSGGRSGSLPRRLLLAASMLVLAGCSSAGLTVVLADAASSGGDSGGSWVNVVVTIAIIGVAGAVMWALFSKSERRSGRGGGDSAAGLGGGLGWFFGGGDGGDGDSGGSSSSGGGSGSWFFGGGDGGDGGSSGCGGSGCGGGGCGSG